MKIYYSKREMLRNVFVGVALGAVVAFVVVKISDKESSDSTTQTESEIAETQTNEIEENSTNALSELDSQNEKIAELSRKYDEMLARVSTVAKTNTQYTIDEQQNISVYEKCNGAVVNITTQEMTAPFWFFEPTLQEGGSGTGSIIDKRGYVITNVHVISNASKINISLADGSSYEGSVVGADVESDIAILKFDPKGKELSTIAFGNSENLKVGQKVIAIGNPFAVERTMTTGIISGLGRPIQESTNVIIRNMIQTDAAINPGNSGGPLLDTSGRMIGINTMIISNSGSSAGLGFAVPVSTAQRVAADLIQYGKVNRGKLSIAGVQMTRSIAQAINSSQGQKLGLSRVGAESGILITEVVQGSNAEKAGLKGGTVNYQPKRGSSFNVGGDIIVQIDSIPVESYADYMSALESKRPGDSVTVRILRGEETLSLKIKLD